MKEFSLTRKSNHDPDGNHDGIQTDRCLEMLAPLHIEKSTRSKSIERDGRVFSV